MKNVYTHVLAFLVITTLFPSRVVAQEQPEKRPLISLRGYLWLLANGIGAEYHLDKRHAFQVFYAATFLSSTPSIDLTRTESLFLDYRYYFSPDTSASGKLRKWFVSPHFKYSWVAHGQGKDAFDDNWLPETSEDKMVGILIGRQVYFRRNNFHIELFAGPQIGVRDSEEKFIREIDQEPFYRNNRQTIWRVRGGLTLGYTFFWSTRQKKLSG